MEMLGSAQVKEEDEDYESPLDILFDRLEMRDPDSIAAVSYTHLISTGQAHGTDGAKPREQERPSVRRELENIKREKAEESQKKSQEKNRGPKKTRSEEHTSELQSQR